MATYTAQEYGELLEKFARGFPKAVSEATFVAAQQLNVNIDARVFTDGGTKTITGGTRRYKSASWIKERKDAGKQVGNVDLVFSGDLQRSLKLFQAKNTVDLKIVGSKKVGKKKVELYEIARGNEARFNGKVFEASKEEEKQAREVFDEYIDEYINKFFD